MSQIFFNPATLKRLSSLKIIARLVVDGFLSGSHRSNFKGFNVEFSEHRPYMRGDEIRNIDWNLWARTDKLHVKRFEEETSLRATMLLDQSASMNFGSGELTKGEYARYLASALSYLMLRQQDSVGLAFFAGELQRYIPPRSGLRHIQNLLEVLESEESQGKTDFSAAFHDLVYRFRRRGMIIVISDLYDNVEEVLKSLKLLRHRKHEIIVFHLLDEAELKFNYKGDTRFVDLESGEELLVTPGQLSGEYCRLLKSFTEQYQSEFFRAGIDYFPLDTSTPFEFALTEYVARRARSGR
jgi:uncharacterized protein (DUF58 family)